METKIRRRRSEAGSARRRGRGPARAALAAGLAALLAGLASLTSCSRPPGGGPAPGETPRNVILVIVDTLRQDALGTYGLPRATSPHLDALASRSTTFQNAYTVSPWTLPSIASMLTGDYPRRHGAKELRSVLPPEARTLAEILREQGFLTAAVVSSLLLEPRHGMNQGFQAFDASQARGHRYVSTPGVTAAAEMFLRRMVADGRRFFLLVHYFDPHYLYNRHPEFGFSAAGAGRLAGADPIERIREIAHDMTDEEAGFLRDSYDEEVRFTDEGIGDLLRFLDELGVAEQTLVVVSADHGEQFHEHGWVGHSNNLYDEVMRVPLIVHHPGLPRGAVVARPVSIVGMTPTILDLLGIPSAAGDFQGESFAPAVLGERAGWDPEMFLEVDLQAVAAPEKTAFLKGVVNGGRKIVRDDSSGAVQLFDLERDPRELDDLAAAEPERVTRLEKRLDARIAAAGRNALAPEEAPASPAELERLRALGYVGD